MVDSLRINNVHDWSSATAHQDGNARLSSAIFEGGTIIHSIVLSFHLQNQFPRYHSAYTIDGKQLDTSRMNSRVGTCTYSGCSTSEGLSINLTAEQFDQMLAPA